MRNRSSWVDVAKALGIILVVYGHVARGLMSARHGGLIAAQEGTLSGVLPYADAVIYSFHMPLFFLLSGLYFSHSLSQRGLLSFVGNKAVTVLYPYVIWTVLQGVVEWQMSRYTNGHVSLSDVFSFAWSPRAQFWFLYVLFICFIFSALIYSIPLEAWSRRSHLLIFIFAVIGYLSRDVLGIGGVANMFAANFVFFAAGVAVSSFMPSVERYRYALLFTGGGLFLALQVYYVARLGGHADPGYQLMLAFVSMALVVGISLCLCSNAPKWLLMIGSSSMTIYLIHILVASGFRIFLSKVLGVQSPGIHLVVGTVCGVFVSLGVGAMLERCGFSFLFRPPTALFSSFNRRRVAYQPSRLSGAVSQKSGRGEGA